MPAVEVEDRYRGLLRDNRARDAPLAARWKVRTRPTCM